MDTYRSSASLSVSLSPPSLSIGGSSAGGGQDGEPLSGAGWSVRPSVTRATPHRGSVIWFEKTCPESVLCYTHYTVWIKKILSHHNLDLFYQSLPLLWWSVWLSAGWVDIFDWLVSKKGTNECHGNTGTERGSTLVQTVCRNKQVFHICSTWLFRLRYSLLYSLKELLKKRFFVRKCSSECKSHSFVFLHQ